ncbi:TPA: DUF1024 family protein, partial [Staphylococcus aureus]|nr:DUF1024 family protein [Staphylococcus aureus]
GIMAGQVIYKYEEEQGK